MRGGRLRTLFEFQERSTTRDSLGERNDTWTKSFSARGWVHTPSARLMVEGQQLQSQQSLVLTMRYRDGVKPGMRAVGGGKTYRIDGVMDAEHRRRRRRELDLTVSEQPIGETT